MDRAMMIYMEGVYLALNARDSGLDGFEVAFSDELVQIADEVGAAAVYTILSLAIEEALA